jgi:hypothetical protein
MSINEYWFSMVLDQSVEFTEDTIDALYEAGCDDALIYGYEDRVFVGFNRKSDTMVHVLAAAVNQVAAAGFKVDKIIVESDD